MGSDKEWYHGELTRDEAEQVLKVSGCDCFLIRHSQGVLVLSLINDGEFHHNTIEYGPGWYELEHGSAGYSFTELEDLVDYYCNKYPISPDISVTLGPVCEKPLGKTIMLGTNGNGDFGEYNFFTGRRDDRSAANECVSSTYTRGYLVGSDKEWYHGELTRDEAEQALKASGCDCFLIRHCKEVLVLSLINDGEFHHIPIKYGPGWYELEHGSAQYSFAELEDLVDHYNNNYIYPGVSVKLGAICEKTLGKNNYD